jgi:hypothetical protein
MDPIGKSKVLQRSKLSPWFQSLSIRNLFTHLGLSPCITYGFIPASIASLMDAVSYKHQLDMPE